MIFNFTILGLFLFFILLSGCKKDPCDNTVCENGGTCIDGVCECAFGYDGEFCENELFGTSLTIDSLEILSYPDPTSSELWDSDYDSSDVQSNPDILIRIFIYYHNPGTYGSSTRQDWFENYNAIDQSSIIYNLAKTDLPYTIPIEVTVTGIRTIYEWEFQLEDYEGLLSSYMCDVEDQLLTEVIESKSDSKLIEDGDLQMRIYYTVTE